MSHLYFLLDDRGDAVPFEGDHSEWVQRWAEQKHSGRFIVRKTKLSDGGEHELEVSTVFTGLNCMPVNDRVEVFETKVFGYSDVDRPLEQFTRRYSNRKDAIKGHAGLVRKLRRNYKHLGGYS